VNLHVPDNTARVLQPVSPKGLHPDEVTLAELLKSAGYATGIIGKWHLGDQPPFLPTRQGFDEYLGIPYSDDMTPREGRPWPPLPLMRGEQVVDAPVDRNLLTRRYTEAALDFIERQRHQPFFLFLSHAMPGSTAAPFASDAFRGRSANGPYGDSVEELDWSTGELLSGLERLNVAANTLILWTSDNGAPRRQPPQGSNAPWKGWGYDCSEGAMRMPCFVRWPGRVPAAAQSDALCTSMDLNPTFARLAGAELPSERLIDGRDIWPVWSGHPEASSPHEAFFYYFNGDLHAVRDARWKLYLPTPAAASNRRAPAILPPGELYDLRDDPAEQTNRATERTEVVARLNALAERCRADLGDGDRGGAGQRPAGWVDEPTPRILEP
jgi:arylsulfatase A-like enzyme